MADVVEEAGYWLPSEFFEDSAMDKESFDKNDAEFCFPTEFPYDFETETEKHLKKHWVMSSSPQSTLAHVGSWFGRSAGGSSNGSPNGVISPPTTPSGAKNDAVRDLIYRAAGRVAKLKLNGGDEPGLTRHEKLLGPPGALEQFYSASQIPSPYFYQNINLLQHKAEQQRQDSGLLFGEPQMHQMRSGRAVGGMGQDAWPVQQNTTRIAGSRTRAAMFGGSGGGAAVKKERTGTGVFLPRRYGNIDFTAPSSDSRKKPGHSSAFVPDRNFRVLNKNFDDPNAFTQLQPQCQPKFNRGLVSDYDLLMARRNARMLQHQLSLLLDGSSPTTHGAFSPDEWTY